MKTGIICAITLTVLGLCFAWFLAKGTLSMAQDSQTTQTTVLENALQ